jgi:hypothetical protein
MPTRLSSILVGPSEIHWRMRMGVHWETGHLSREEFKPPDSHQILCRQRELLLIARGRLSRQFHSIRPHAGGGQLDGETRAFSRSAVYLYFAVMSFYDPRDKAQT